MTQKLEPGQKLGNPWKVDMSAMLRFQLRRSNSVFLQPQFEPSTL